MNRRKFISGSLLFTSGCLAAGGGYGFSLSSFSGEGMKIDRELYDLFRDPDIRYHPFIRWWWNGNKVEADELIRELHLMKEAGLGGVEINPVQFPYGHLGLNTLKVMSYHRLRL